MDPAGYNILTDLLTSDLTDQLNFSIFSVFNVFAYMMYAIALFLFQTSPSPYLPFSSSSYHSHFQSLPM